MSPNLAVTLFIASLVVALFFVCRPLGDYIARTVRRERHLRVERGVYRLVGVDPDSEQTSGGYTRSVLAFSAVCLLVLYALLRLQQHLWGALGLPGQKPALAWNTAVSFVTNTNWQSYSPEQSTGRLALMAGLAVQNFLSAAVGIAVAIAVVRGFSRSKTDRLGNFWVDLTRMTISVLLPISLVGAVILMAGGVVQSLSATIDATSIAGVASHMPLVPAASEEAIKLLGTNGGGIFNANSAHPFENPTAWTNWFEIFLILLIPFSMPRAFGRMVGDKRQGRSIGLVMVILALASAITMTIIAAQHPGTVPTAVGAASEGTELRFGPLNSAVFEGATTLTSTGAVDATHDSTPALAGGLQMFNMMLGEVAPGGVGSGLYGILILAVITVFIAGLMVGRTPEYLGKKVGAREMKFASLFFLTTPTLVLVGTAAAIASPGVRASMANTGAHGFSEILYAFTSAANNNGSAFAGLSANTTWLNTALGLAMLLARFAPIVFALGMAGSFARQSVTPPSAGTFPTTKPLFVGLLVGVTLILVALTFLPALALGPIAEGLF